MKRLVPIFVVLAMILAACGDDASDDTGGVAAGQGSGGDDASGSDGSDSDGGAGSDGSGSDDSGSDDGSGDDSGSGSDGSDDANTGDDTGNEPDNEDAAEITGNPDLDLDDLDDDTADALDAIDDIVSIGDCQSEFIGLAMTYVPEGWKCRVLDQVTAGLDGFTLFMDNNQGGIEITIGTPSPTGAICEVLVACDQAEPIDLGDTFDMEVINIGVPLIYGTHKTVNAEATVVTFEELTDADVAFVTMVLNGVEEI